MAGAVTKLVGTQNPLAGFALGVASHYVIDAFPHWDYKPSIITKDPKNPRDVVVNLSPKVVLVDGATIAFDALVGAAVLFASWKSDNIPLLAAAALGGILPDALQMVYGVIKKFPFTFTQSIHDFFHTTNRLTFTRFAFVSQLALFAVATLLLR